MIERTTVRLPRELMTRAKRKAAAEGRTLTALIEDSVRAALDDSAKPVKRRDVVLPRVSKAKGWLRPGLTLADIEEMDDLEYVERMKHFK
jgi:predicted DNA-binding protein